MKNKLLVYFVMFFMMLVASSLGFQGDTEAATVYKLNQIISSKGVSSSPVSYGTMTLTDNGDAVDFLIDLVDPSTGKPMKILQVYLNYDDSIFDSNVHDFNPSGSPFIREDENSITSAGGYVDAWDLEVPATGNFGYEPQSFTVTLPGFDLNPEHFSFTDNRGGNLIGGVQIGSIGGKKRYLHLGEPPDHLIGALSIPIPSAIWLLGSGLISILGVRREFKK